MEVKRMALLEVGERAPAFRLRTQDGGVASLDQYRGHHVVLWWYPKADTPG
jgi:peroxiredoxin Q/BCP